MNTEVDSIRQPNASYIRLCGEPYQRVVRGYRGDESVDCSVTFANLVTSTRYRESLPGKVRAAEKLLDPLFENGGYDYLDERLKHGANLSFEEAFSLATYVCCALNKPLSEEMQSRSPDLSHSETNILRATALLSVISAKESYVGLSPEEIAGLVAATIFFDTVVRVKLPYPVVAFGGMGGDTGYLVNGRKSKLFSLSTFSAVGLSVDSPVLKHHSYPNKSRVAGQSAIEAYGARSDFHTPEAFYNVLAESGLLMTSCHDTRSLHTLSHKLRGETINHVIGPLSFTVSADTPIHAMIGVNEKIHPETITQALEILDRLGFQKYVNGAVYCGTDLVNPPIEFSSPLEYQRNRDLKAHVALDEVAPPPYVTIVSFLKNGRSIGTYFLYPEDFYPPEQLDKIKIQDLLISNTADGILKANEDAITNQDESKARYLAMTIALGLFTKYALDNDAALDSHTQRVNPLFLRNYTELAYGLIKGGRVKDQLERYVHATQKYAGEQPNAIV